MLEYTSGFLVICLFLKDSLKSVIVSWRVREERFLMMLQWISWSVVVGIASFLVLLFFRVEDGSRAKEFALAKRSDPPFSHERIGAGPLALNRDAFSPFATLMRELVVLGKNTRPDAKLQDTQILLGLCSAGQHCSIKSETPIFLDITLNDLGKIEAIQFAKQPTEFWITSHDLDARSLLIEVGDSPLFADVEKKQFALEIPSCKQPQEGHAALCALQSARFIGYDAFFRIYAEKEHYRTLAQRQRVEFTGPEGSYILFLQPGDTLSWQEGKWQKGIDPNAMLSSIEQMGEQDMAFRVWDESGFHCTEVKVQKKRIEESLPRIENFLSGARRRTKTQVTALLGGKRVILKPGDWFIQTKNGWRNLHSLADIEAYLDYKLTGVLFVFDEIQTAADGKPVLVGHLFNETRTMTDIFVVAVYQDSALQKGNQKRKK